MIKQSWVGTLLSLHCVTLSSVCGLLPPFRTSPTSIHWPRWHQPPSSSRLASTFVGTNTEKDEGKSAYDENTGFWRKARPTEGTLEDTSTTLPSLPSLDAHGELPRGAYFPHGQGTPSENSKDFCRLSLALDCGINAQLDDLDISQSVRMLQQYFDDGFQTFHIKTGPTQRSNVVEQEILGRFFTETPAMARDRCSVVVPLRIPSAQTAVSPKFVRRAVTASLLRLGGESIDCVQLQHREKSPYLLDVLDSLEDLKREGLVRSVSSRNLPTGTIREARANDFQINSSQISCNILDPTAYTVEQKLMCSDLHMPLLAEGPLAGGLLSDRYLPDIFEPVSSRLSPSSNRYLKSVMPMWNKRFSESTQVKPWKRFHEDLLPTLSHIALKHRVSIATVCLRWVLQLNHVASTVVSCNLFNINAEDEGKTARRIKSYRDVFRFELDEEDMGQIWTLSGMVEPSEEFSLSFNADELEENFSNFEEKNGLCLP